MKKLGIMLGIAFLAVLLFGASPSERVMWNAWAIVDVSPDSQVVFSADVVSDSTIYTMGTSAQPWQHMWTVFLNTDPQGAYPVSADTGQIFYYNSTPNPGWKGYREGSWVSIPYIDTGSGASPNMEDYLRVDTLDTIFAGTFITDTLWFSDSGADSAYITQSGTALEIVSDNYVLVYACPLVVGDSVKVGGVILSYGATDTTELRTTGLFDIDSIGFDNGAYIINNHADSLLIEKAIAAFSGDLVVEGNDIVFGSGAIIDQPHADTLDITEKAVAISADSMFKVNAAHILMGVVSSSSSTGFLSFAVGYQDTASDTCSFAGGKTCKTSGGYSFAWGAQNTVSGGSSVAFGDGSSVSSNCAGAFGHDNSVSGAGSFAFGGGHTVQTPYSYSFGSGNSVLGVNDSFNLCFGNACFIDSANHSILFGIDSNDSLSTDNTFKIAMDSIILDGASRLTGDVFLTTGKTITLADTSLADSFRVYVGAGSTYIESDNPITIESNVTLEADMKLTGNTLTFGGGAVIENPHGDTLSIAETNLSLEGILVLANGGVIDQPHADSLTINETNIKLEGITTLTGILTLSNGGIIDNPHADSITITGTYIKPEGTIVFTNGATITTPHDDTLTITEANVKIAGNLHATSFVGAGDVWEDTANIFTATQTIDIDQAGADTGSVVRMDSTTGHSDEATYGLLINGTAWHDDTQFPIKVIWQNGSLNLFSVNGQGDVDINGQVHITQFIQAAQYYQKNNTDLVVAMTETDEFMLIGTENTTNGMWLCGHGDALSDTVSGIHIDSSCVTMKGIGYTATGFDTIASAATIDPNENNNIIITGTADIDSIDTSSLFPNYGIMYIEFTGTKATTGVIDGKNLKLAGNFAYSPDDMLVLQRRGNIFYEISRSSN